MIMRIGRINQRSIDELASASEVRDKVQAGATKIAQDARRLAPKLTGALRDSITVEEISDSEFRVGWDTSIADYGPYVEFGTEDTPPQPHLRPAAYKARGR